MLSQLLLESIAFADCSVSGDVSMVSFFRCDRSIEMTIILESA